MKLLASLLVLFLPALASAQVVGNYALYCDNGGILTAAPDYSYSGGGQCVAPAPHDRLGKPPAGWGATPSCDTGGTFYCGAQTLTSYNETSASGAAASSDFAALTLSVTNTFVNGAVLNGFVVGQFAMEPERRIEVHVDGGIQVGNATAGNYVIADVFLYREHPANTFTQIAAKRVTAQNVGAVQTSTPFAFSTVDKPPVPTLGGADHVISYRVSAQVISTNTTGSTTGDNVNATRIRITGQQGLH